MSRACRDRRAETHLELGREAGPKNKVLGYMIKSQKDENREGQSGYGYLVYLASETAGNQERSTGLHVHQQPTHGGWLDLLISEGGCSSSAISGFLPATG